MRKCIVAESRSLLDMFRFQSGDLMVPSFITPVKMIPNDSSNAPLCVVIIIVQASSFLFLQGHIIVLQGKLQKCCNLCFVQVEVAIGPRISLTRGRDKAAEGFELSIRLPQTILWFR
jgi:hypothetical protein